MERTVEAADRASSVAEGAPAGVAEHLAPADSLDVDAELLQLARGLRRQIERLREAGVTGLPRPKASPRRVEAAAGPVPSDIARPARPDARPTPDMLDERGAPSMLDERGPPSLDESPPPRVAEHAPPAMRPQPAVSGRPAAPVAPPSAMPPMRPPTMRPTDGAPPGRSFQLVEASYAELPAPGVLRGRDGLAELARLLSDCQRCKLCHGRNHIVFADGNPDAVLAFVGEGPGADEDRLGRPFVGAAGQLLDKMIDAMAAEARKRGYADLAGQLSRQAVYICNVVKCRPPGNRTPEPDEMSACAPFLRRQLLALRPGLRAIVALGRTPTQYLLRSTAPISGLRGSFTPWEGIPVMPTYHPAYLLRTPSAKRQVWEDLQKVLEALGQPRQSSSGQAASVPHTPDSPEP